MIFYATLLVVYISLAYATCGCVCNSNLIAVPFIEELKDETNCAPINGPTEPACFLVDCIKCGPNLECNIPPNAPAELKEIIQTTETFCPNEKTKCNQPCPSLPAVIERDPSEYCPAQEGTTIKTCATGKDISNIASYEICIGGNGATCTASGMCDSGNPGIYRCEATNCIAVGSSIECVGEKCDTSETEPKTCSCLRM